MSNSNEAAEQVILQVLQAELARLRDSITDGRRSYHTWATWFLGLQAAGLGWILATAQKLESAPYMKILAGAAVILNMLGVHAALRDRSFVVLQMKRADVVCKAVMRHTELTGLSVEITSGFPGELFRLGGSINAAAFSIAAVAWSYIVLA